MYSFCSFWYVLVTSLGLFLILVFVGFLLFHKNTIFMLSQFFLTVSVSHGTLCLAFSLVGFAFCCCFHEDIDKVFILFIWITCFRYLMKCIEFVSYSYLYLLLISLLVSENQSYLVVLTVSTLFLQRLRHIFAVTIL